MPDTDREARLEEIRERREYVLSFNVVSIPYVDAERLIEDDIDWLLSEIDHLKAKLEGDEDA